MSPQNQAASEVSPLLADTRPAGRSRSPLGERFKPETLLIPVVFASALGGVIPSTTLFELLRQAVCRLSSISHGSPSSLIPGGTGSPDLCDAPEAVQDFATATAILGAIGGIISMLGCGILSRLSPRYGRKPIFLFIVILKITWSCLIAVSQFMPDRLADWVFFSGMLVHLLSGALPAGYVINMYIIDVCVPENRTATLSKIGGWGALGACIPLALGGIITTKTGNPLIVFYIATAIFIALLIYVVFVLPETFPEEKRSAMYPEPSTHPTTTRFGFLLHIFEPLKMLVPARSASGTRNWRLTWCAAHAFLYLSAHPFSSSAWLVLVTSKFHLTPADNGILFTMSTASGMIVLTAIVPPLVRFLRSYYTRPIVRSSLADEGPSDGTEPETETSDRLDVHLAFISCLITATFILCAAASETKLTLIVSTAFIGLSSIHGPTMRSLVAGSVDPLKQGDAIATIEMVDSAARVLSPLIMGSILSTTVDTVPQCLLYVQLAGVLISAELLFLIRDTDRYKSDGI